MTAPPSAWSAYWEGMEHRHIFTVEARDHVARLRRVIPLRPTDRVLDFGCGFGHVVELLAPSVGFVGYWDAAERMRHATAERTAGLETVAPVDPRNPESGSTPFDVVLANSVVQYMAVAELGDWMDRWRSLLARSGRIVLSDVPTPGTSALDEVLGMLRFAARHRFLLRALRDGLVEARRYARSRGATELTCWKPDDLVHVAAEHGLSATILPANLTHRSKRFTTLLTAMPPAAGSVGAGAFDDGADGADEDLGVEGE